MGQKRLSAGHKTKSTGQAEVGHSRARTPFSEGMSHLSQGHKMHGTRDTEVVGQDRTSTPFRIPSHPTAKIDSRFAGWIAGASQAQADRFAADMLTPEQRELFRLCGERILANHAAGRKVTPEALADGKRWAAFPPLAGPMSAGVPDNELPAPLRGGNLEVF